MGFGVLPQLKHSIEPLHSKPNLVYCATSRWETVLVALFPTARHLPPSSPIWCFPVAPSSVLPLSHVLSVFSHLSKPGLGFLGIGIEYIRFPVKQAVCSTLRIPELFALLFTPNNVSISSLGLNPECWLLASPESCCDFKMPNSLILFLGFLPPGLIFDSSGGNWAPAGSVRRTPGLGTAGGKCGADWGPRSKLEQKVILPTISEFGNHLIEALLPALICSHPLCTPPPAGTQ